LEQERILPQLLIAVRLLRRCQSTMTVTRQDPTSQGQVVTDITAKELAEPAPPAVTKAEAKRTKEAKQQKSNKPVALIPPTARADATR
jgi:hypothetical protein